MMSHGHIRARSALCVVAAAAVVGVPASSAAERPPRPDETAAAAVYREFIPTALGSRPSAESTPAEASPSESSSGAVGIPLTPEANAAVSEAEPAERAALEKVATSPRFGAPERRLPPPADTGREAVPSTLGAVSTTESGRLVALALALLGVTALLGAIAFRRRRPTAGH